MGATFSLEGTCTAAKVSSKADIRAKNKFCENARNRDPLCVCMSVSFFFSLLLYTHLPLTFGERGRKRQQRKQHDDGGDTGGGEADGVTAVRFRRSISEMLKRILKSARQRPLTPFLP